MVERDPAAPLYTDFEQACIDLGECRDKLASLRAQVAAANKLAAACALFVPSGAYGTAVMDRLARLTSIQQADAFVQIRMQLEAYLAVRAP